MKSFIVRCDHPPIGSNGLNGLKGVNGLNGLNGLKGINGLNGLNGFAVFLICVSGFQNKVRPLKSLILFPYKCPCQE